MNFKCLEDQSSGIRIIAWTSQECFCVAMVVMVVIVFLLGRRNVGKIMIFNCLENRRPGIRSIAGTPYECFWVVLVRLG